MSTISVSYKTLIPDMGQQCQEAKFSVALKTIHNSYKQDAALHCDVQFELTFDGQTQYFTFTSVPNQTTTEYDLKVKRFILLFSRVEFVSLTYNTVYIDAKNSKFVWRLRMLPHLSFVFDILDDGLGPQQLELMFLEVRNQLGYLKVAEVRMALEEYISGASVYQKLLEELEPDSDSECNEGNEDEDESCDKESKKAHS